MENFSLFTAELRSIRRDIDTEEYKYNSGGIWTKPGGKKSYQNEKCTIKRKK